MARKIVITTDGSSHSHRVFGHAAALAKAIDAELLLLTIAEASASAATALPALEHALQRAGIEAQAMVGEARPGEHAAEAIVRIAREQGASLLAMDSRGHSALHHVLVGSVAMKVLETSALPVLLTGANADAAARDGDYGLVITSDGSHAATGILHALAPVLEGSRVKALLMRVYEPRQGDNESAEMAEATDKLLQLRALLPQSLPVETFVRKIIPGGGTDTAIIEKAAETGANAIALSTHGFRAARHLLMGSTASLLMGRSPLPLILSRSLD